MSNISTHFEMLMDKAEQERIGATPDKGDAMRVMRVLSHYDGIRTALKAWVDNWGGAKNDADFLRSCAALGINPND